MLNNKKISVIGAALLGASTLFTNAAMADGVTVGPEVSIDDPAATRPERPAVPTRESCAADLEDSVKEDSPIRINWLINGVALNDFGRVAIGYIENDKGELELTGCTYSKFANDPARVKFVQDPATSKGLNTLLRTEDTYLAKHSQMCGRINGTKPPECTR
jgi:hypothetical protein